MCSSDLAASPLSSIAAQSATVCETSARCRGELGAVIARAAPWQRALVSQTVADCAAMLDSGLAALGTLARRGQDPAAPALVLWREFHAARAAMVSVLQNPRPD